MPKKTFSDCQWTAAFFHLIQRPNILPLFLSPRASSKCRMFLNINSRRTASFKSGRQIVAFPCQDWIRSLQLGGIVMTAVRSAAMQNLSLLKSRADPPKTWRERTLYVFTSHSRYPFQNLFPPLYILLKELSISSWLQFGENSAPKGGFPSGHEIWLACLVQVNPQKCLKKPFPEEARNLPFWFEAANYPRLPQTWTCPIS